MADLFTQADIEEQLGRVLTTEEADLADNQLIPSISQYARNFCNRTFDVTGEQTEVFDSEGDTIFFIQEPPIDAIISVTYISDILDTDDFFKYDTYVELNFTPIKGNQNVTIVYTSSNALTDDLKYGLVAWSIIILNGSEASSTGAVEGELKRFTAGSVTVEYRDTSSAQVQVASMGIFIPTQIYDVLKRYRLDPK